MVSDLPNIIQEHYKSLGRKYVIVFRNVSAVGLRPLRDRMILRRVMSKFMLYISCPVYIRMGLNSSTWQCCNITCIFSQRLSAFEIIHDKET